MAAIPEVQGELEDGHDAKEHLEGVQIQGEGAAGDEGRAFGVEAVADPIGRFSAGFAGDGGGGEG